EGSGEGGRAGLNVFVGRGRLKARRIAPPPQEAGEDGVVDFRELLGGELLQPARGDLTRRRLLVDELARGPPGLVVQNRIDGLRMRGCDREADASHGRAAGKASRQAFPGLATL